MRTTPGAPFVVLAALLATTACNPDLSTPAGAEITCSTQADCPDGLACRNGLCVSVAGGDAVAPGVVPGSVTVAPSALAAGDVLIVTFDVSETLQTAPRVTLDVGGGTFRPLVLDAASTPATLHYVFKYTAAGDETEGRTSLLTADLLDTAGNRASGIVLGSVVHDFTAPGVAVHGIDLLPGPGNPLARVDAAGPGTEVVITLQPDEQLSAAAVPSLAVTAPGGAITFTRDAAASSDVLATFTAVVGAADADGTYTASVTWSDAAGNAATRATGVSFTVRTSAPVLAVDQAAVRFVRSPWGAAALETLGAFTVPAGPFFGVAPAATLSGGAALPAATFALAGGRPLAKVRVWTDAARSTLLGDLSPVAGGWERRALDRRDTPAAWVTGVDDAGNESAPVEIAAGEWVATSNPPVGVPVHEVTATASVSPALAQSPVGMSATEVAAVPGLVAAADDDGATAGKSLTVASTPRWIASPTSAGDLPSARAALRLAYDPLRRRVVLFAGSTVPGSSADAFDDTWEWDGARWTEVTPLGAPPPRRDGHVLFYDARRGTVVLFGGSGDFCLDDLWEWDGQRWRPIAQAPGATGPINCGRGAGTYDPDRGVLVYWPGESAEVWTWDGTGWTLQPGGEAGPTARRYADMAYDPVRRAVVLYGGWSTDFSTVFAETWEWDGAAWHLRNPASAPGPRRQHRMAWDPLRQKVVLTGGRDQTGIGVFADVWAWNGADWLNVTPAGPGPTPRSDHAVAWDDVTGQLMLVGGDGQFSGLLPADTWHVGSAGWVAQPTSFPRPTQRKDHAMAADPAGGALLFGGVDNNNPLNAPSVLADTWRYRSPVWTQLFPGASPTARVGHAMATTAAGVALFGGFGPGATPQYRSDLHLWNGTTWVPQAATGGPPAARTGAGLAYDSFRGRLVMFGGSNGAPLGDVWEYGPAGWANRTPATGPHPDARAYHGMVYDEDSRQVIVFGGCRNPRDDFARCGDIPSPDQTPNFYFGDVWAWNGTGWTQLADGGPYRGSFASAWSPPQHRTVAFGGYDGWNVLGLPAEWDGQWWGAFLSTGAPTTLSAAMAFDATSGRTVLFGGDAGNVSAQSWEWDAPPARQPAVQLTVSTAPSGIDPATVEEVRVRAVCGGFFAPYTAGSSGAALWGWSSRGGRLGLGGWVRLAGAAGGVSATTNGLATPAASRIEWTSASPAEARLFLLTTRALAAFQCRPDGPAVDVTQRGLAPAQGFGEAVVAADYLEVRVRYQAP